MQIYNVDEVGITIAHKPGKVIAELGRKYVWSVTSAEKEKIILLLLAFQLLDLHSLHL